MSGGEYPHDGDPGRVFYHSRQPDIKNTVNKIKVRER